jgi:hypothetical protein
MDPAHFLDGLFVPRARKGQALYDVRAEWDHGEVRFRGEQLSAEDQSILLAVAARTGRDGLVLTGDQRDLRARQLDLLKAAQEASDQDISLVEATAYSLLHDAGLPANGTYYKRMVESLQKLSTTTMYRKLEKRGASSHLLTFGHDDDTGELRISLNWRMTRAIFGLVSAQWVLVSLHERRDLRSPTAKVLHAWLSAFVRLGERYGFEKNPPYLESLIPHVWGHRPVASGTKRRRLQALREALSEIDGLSGWVAQPEGKRVLVSRPHELPWAEMTGTPGEQEEIDELFRDEGW